MQGMDPRGGAGPSGSNSLVPLAASLGAMAPPGSRTVLTRTTTQTVSGIAPPAAAPFSKLRDLAAKMSSDQAQIAQQAKEAAAQLARGEEVRHKLAADVASLSKQVRCVYQQRRGGSRAASAHERCTCAELVGTLCSSSWLTRRLSLHPRATINSSATLPRRTTTCWPPITS